MGISGSFWPCCPGSRLGFCPPPPQPDRLVFPVPSPQPQESTGSAPAQDRAPLHMLTLCWPGWPCMGSWAQASSPEAAGAAGPLPPAVDPQSSWKSPEDLSYSQYRTVNPTVQGEGSRVTRVESKAGGPSSATCTQGFTQALVQF